MATQLQDLFDQLAAALGVSALVPASDGGIYLDTPKGGRIALFGEDANTLMVVAPVMALPVQTDYTAALWLLRRNFYDSPLAPFKVGCDPDGTLVIWGRLPVDGLTGEELAAVLDAVAGQVRFIQEELATGEPPPAD